ncbi:MAG TPA: zinc ribbon domain-containing protein [Smithellaceae bacterium]|jgi:putative FmdB family regulatory protein|nr:zinc ribbon domain-containing protein [Syntrophales bacterium]HRY34946.1 zinc ribbon domain-containing protein [Smithellaceae bacterium]
MPTYEYECESCSLRFERWQGINEAPVVQCPECNGKVHRLISGGAGFIMKGADSGGLAEKSGGCAFEETGRTCCGRNERCGQSACGSE